MKCFIITIFFFVFLTGKEYELKLNLEKNQTYYQSSTSEMQVKHELNGHEIEITSKFGGKCSFKVLEVFEDYFDLLVQYESIFLTMQTSPGTVIYSSKNKDSTDLFSEMMKGMTFKPFKVKMKNNGTIKEIQNIDTLYSSIINSFPELTPLKKKQIIEQLKQSYGEKAIRGNFEMITAIYPNKKVKLNEKWRNQTKLESGMSISLNNIFELTEVNETYASIKGKSESYTEPQEEYTNEVSGMPAKYNLTGTMDYDIKIDKNSGWVIEATIIQNFNGDVEISDNQKMPGGTTIPIELKSKMIISD